MQALAASCEELRARTGNPPLHSVKLSGVKYGALLANGLIYLNAVRCFDQQQRYV
jgi:hypothetical protein